MTTESEQGMLILRREDIVPGGYRVDAVEEDDTQYSNVCISIKIQDIERRHDATPRVIKRYYYYYYYSSKFIFCPSRYMSINYLLLLRSSPCAAIQLCKHGPLRCRSDLLPKGSGPGLRGRSPSLCLVSRIAHATDQSTNGATLFSLAGLKTWNSSRFDQTNLDQTAGKGIKRLFISCKLVPP